MFFEEPKVEFVQIDTNDAIACSICNETEVDSSVQICGCDEEESSVLLCSSQVYAG